MEQIFLKEYNKCPFYIIKSKYDIFKALKECQYGELRAFILKTGLIIAWDAEYYEHSRVKKIMHLNNIPEVRHIIAEVKIFKDKIHFTDVSRSNVKVCEENKLLKSMYGRFCA